jgi:hypothetical protein
MVQYRILGNVSLYNIASEMVQDLKTNNFSRYELTNKKGDCGNTAIVLNNLLHENGIQVNRVYRYDISCRIVAFNV